MGTVELIKKIINESGDRFIAIEYTKKDGERKNILASHFPNPVEMLPSSEDTVMVFDVLEGKPKKLLVNGIISIQANQLHIFKH